MLLSNISWNTYYLLLRSKWNLSSRLTFIIYFHFHFNPHVENVKIWIIISYYRCNGNKCFKPRNPTCGINRKTRLVSFSVQIVLPNMYVTFYSCKHCEQKADYIVFVHVCPFRWVWVFFVVMCPCFLSCSLEQVLESWLNECARYLYILFI